MYDEATTSTYFGMYLAIESLYEGLKNGIEAEVSATA